MQEQIIKALMWPVNDVPKIIHIGTTGVGPAVPALAEVGVAAGVLIFRVPTKKYTAVDALVAYAAAAAVSFAFMQMQK